MSTMADPSPLLPSIDTTPIPKGRLSVTPNLLQAKLVNALRADANALYLAGAFVPGGLRRRRPNNENKKDNVKTTTNADETDETTRVCDVCGLFDDAENADDAVGNRNAREDLFDLMSDLREMLERELHVKLLESMELQYLRYPGSNRNNNDATKKNKGFYGRHFDRTSDDATTCQRKISLLLYLNADGWNAETDGGVLRAYIRPKNANNESISVQDVVPEGGKLVLFDSSSVEHEVLPTCKERWAVVGWFLSEKGAARRGGGGGDGGKKRSHHSGEEQMSSSKRKKKKKRRKGR
mmetsp:Transcript_8336/g.18686  ORF Transcript_8336/g.18686 Transcript_8336/m.18686 type:complete len:295 (+) Transcript_8336:20-904(+)